MTLRRPAAVAVLAAVLFARPALAHVGSLSAVEAGSVPLWLVVLTGGGVVGASFMFTTLMTDHAAIRAVNGLAVRFPAGAARRAAVRVARALGVAVLAGVVVAGLVGPADPVRNFATLVVWVGWWAGFTMSVYLVGNAWPAVDPWRTLAGLLPEGDADLPASATWASVAGLLGLVVLEVVSPVSESPRLLAAVVAGYTVATVAGAARYGVDDWFAAVDPVARVFRCYGRVAPVQRTDAGFSLRLPGTALVDRFDADETPFVVALLWVTTYDGLVSTPPWRALAGAVVGLGVPALLLYLVAALAGYALFYYAYDLAAGLARRTADTYVTADYLRARFAPALLPIAAGYHVAHFLGYFLGLVPVLVAVLANPLAPGPAVRLVLPGWFSSLRLVFVLVGHLLAVWVAHAIAFDVFSGRLQPIRSQYPFIVVMVFFTMSSMWVVAQPFAPPPYV